MTKKSKMEWYDWTTYIIVILAAIEIGIIGFSEHFLSIRYGLIATLSAISPHLVHVIYMIVGLFGIYALFMGFKLGGKK